MAKEKQFPLTWLSVVQDLSGSDSPGSVALHQSKEAAQAHALESVVSGGSWYVVDLSAGLLNEDPEAVSMGGFDRNPA